MLRSLRRPLTSRYAERNVELEPLGEAELGERGDASMAQPSIEVVRRRWKEYTLGWIGARFDFLQ